MLQYFTRKVEKYMQQDKKANRPIDDASFITKEWLVSFVGQECDSCGDGLAYNISHGKIDCNLAVHNVNKKRGAPSGHHRTLLRLLQYGNVKQIERIYLI